MGCTSAQLDAARQYKERNKDNPEYVVKRKEQDKRCYLKNCEKRRAFQREYRKKNKEKIREAARKVRVEVLCYYGGSPPKCACCGETHMEFLAIDHVKGNGNEHRKKVGSGYVFCYWLRAHGFPKGFRVLCHNCNLARGFYGYCPHDGGKNGRYFEKF